LNRPDLTDKEVLESWSDEEPLGDEDKPFDLRIMKGYTILKAKTRALILWYAYNLRPPAIDDFKRLFNFRGIPKT